MIWRTTEEKPNTNEAKCEEERDGVCEEEWCIENDISWYCEGKQLEWRINGSIWMEESETVISEILVKQRDCEDREETVNNGERTGWGGREEGCGLETIWPILYGKEECQNKTEAMKIVSRMTWWICRQGKEEATKWSETWKY